MIWSLLESVNTDCHLTNAKWKNFSLIRAATFSCHFFSLLEARNFFLFNVNLSVLLKNRFVYECNRVENDYDDDEYATEKKLSSKKFIFFIIYRKRKQNWFVCEKL